MAYTTSVFMCNVILILVNFMVSSNTSSYLIDIRTSHSVNMVKGDHFSDVLHMSSCNRTPGDIEVACYNIIPT